ncbi:neuferricin isoform X6 [Peromyscus californicus insignis]|uniref:neuferricin isoform X6 n=1 Tax=Peromyscus californicus insignis TaxID=564181 RepID=UPI0022A6DFDF|nr:neuferricin isoform X6 [Peromyscus californicus insignis]
MLRLCGLGVVLSLVAAAAAVMAMWLVDWWGPCPGLRLFVPEELARYRGGPGDPGLYLALLGRVYDVSSGRRHYEPGAHYSGFAGRLVGRFYGEDGLPTPELTQVEALVAKGAEASEQQQREKHRFPPCNAEWSSAKGSRVWCSQKRGIQHPLGGSRPSITPVPGDLMPSLDFCRHQEHICGGVNRDWTGVPRKLYKPGAKEPHCVCVRTTGPSSDQQDNSRHLNRGDLDNPNLEEYPGCSPLAIECTFPP